MQSLSAIAGTGEAVSPEYLAKRIAEESRHGANDDGTVTLSLRAFGNGHDYDEGTDPIQDTDQPSRLTEFGLSERDCNRICEHCHTIGEVRTAAANHQVQTWRQSGPVCEKHVIAALKKADKVTG